MTKSRFSMDWFYPILTGALTDGEAQRRIEKYWDRFVVKGHGVRCVSDQPWVTIAETSELVMALAAMGNTGLAHIVFSWIQDRRFEDGSYWAGYTYPDMVIWPEDKITWTNAGVLMVLDTLYGLTPAGRLFSHNYWKSPGIHLLHGLTLRRLPPNQQDPAPPGSRGCSCHGGTALRGGGAFSNPGVRGFR